MDNDEQNLTIASTNGVSSSQIKPNDVHVMLAKAIHKHKNIIINASNCIPRDKISQEKEKAWESIRMEMVNAGIQRFSTRTWRTVRDVDWQHLRRRVVNKIAENMRIYQVPNKDLNELDLLVLDTLGKTHTDGSIDFSDLIKTDPVDEMPKSVSSDRSELDENSAIASTNSLLVEMIEEYGSANKLTKRANSSLDQNDCLKKKICSKSEYSTPENIGDTLPNNDKWEAFLRELGVGRNLHDEDLIKEENQLNELRLTQEKYRTEAEKYRSEQERYKSLQERWKSEIEKIRLEEARIRLNRLKNNEN